MNSEMCPKLGNLHFVKTECISKNNKKKSGKISYGCFRVLVHLLGILRPGATGLAKLPDQEPIL